jgi:uncharacterized protein with GYD domain
LFFIFLLKWKEPMTKDKLDSFSKIYADMQSRGIKLQLFWTLGSYNFVTIMEAPSEIDAMKLLLPLVDVGNVDVLTAIPREEALKLL